MIVLFLDTLILQTGISLNGTPLNNLVGVFASGKISLFLKPENMSSLIKTKYRKAIIHFEINESMSKVRSPAVPSSFAGIEALI